jgi:hypothetical protein
MIEMCFKYASRSSFIGCSPSRIAFPKPAPTGKVHLPPFAIQFVVMFGEEPTDHPSPRSRPLAQGSD